MFMMYVTVSILFEHDLQSINPVIVTYTSLSVGADAVSGSGGAHPRMSRIAEKLVHEQHTIALGAEWRFDDVARQLVYPSSQVTNSRLSAPCCGCAS